MAGTHSLALSDVCVCVVVGCLISYVIYLQCRFIPRISRSHANTQAKSSKERRVAVSTEQLQNLLVSSRLPLPLLASSSSFSPAVLLLSFRSVPLLRVHSSVDEKWAEISHCRLRSSFFLLFTCRLCPCHFPSKSPFRTALR